MKNVAFYAHLDNLEGFALRIASGEVHFQATSTGLWTQLFDADASRLHLHGRVDLAASQALADGNLVRKASRTLQRAA
jgi:hypothetical protein